MMVNNWRVENVVLDDQTADVIKSLWQDSPAEHRTGWFSVLRGMLCLSPNWKTCLSDWRLLESRNRVCGGEGHRSHFGIYMVMQNCLIRRSGCRMLCLCLKRARYDSSSNYNLNFKISQPSCSTVVKLHSVVEHISVRIYRLLYRKLTGNILIFGNNNLSATMSIGRIRF